MAEVRAETLSHPVPQPWGDTLSRRRIGFVIAAVMLGMFLSALDQMLVSTALPTIIGSLHGMQHFAWVATGYLLASMVSMPIWGKLSDAYGRKRFFILGMAIFITGTGGALVGIPQAMVWKLMGINFLVMGLYRLGEFLQLHGAPDPVQVSATMTTDTQVTHTQTVIETKPADPVVDPKKE